MTHWTRERRLALFAIAVLLLEACSLLPGSAEKKAAAAAAESPRIGLEVSGVEGAVVRNIRAHVSLTSKPCTVSPSYLLALGERAEDETQEALQAFGYYASRVTVDIDRSGDCPLARIAVTAGDPVLLDKVAIEIRGPGGSDTGFQAQVESIALNVGDTLNHQNYASAKQLIESVALERGYLDGKFVTRQLKVDPAGRRAEVNLIFDSGPRYLLGEIYIEQEPAFLDETLIRRFLENTAGDPYTAARVASYQRALSKGSYFNQVEVRPRLSAPVDNTIPVDIKLTPRHRHKFSYGIGMSTDEGIRGRASYQNRRLNHAGHQLDIAAKGSLIEQTFTTGYRIPRRNPVDEWLTLQAGVKRRDVDTFDSIETQVSVSETKRRPWGWMETHFIELNREDYTVAGPNEVSIFLSPGVNWRRTTSDNDIFPTRGYSINLELKGAAEPVFSDTSFAYSLLKLASVYSLPFELRALLRGRFGAIWVDDFERLPPSKRFFAGGDNSIRGYEIDSLGPVDADNDVIGGTYLAIFNLEFDHYFTDSWGVAAFVDSGNAFGGDGNSQGFRTGIGAGVRWRSPIGAIRVDVAHPLDDPSEDFRIHLRIGPDL